jgi:4-amino-4-deoxy-L-arabinose transferase-like glycosyltransferase
MLHQDNKIQSLRSRFQDSEFFSYVSLLIWILPLLLFNSGNNSLMAHDEGLYATRARLMYDSGDWIHPWQDAHHKTPGIYWIIALSYKLFGISELSVRLPSMILGTISIFILYEIGKIILDKKIAWLAAAIFSVEFLWLQYCRLGTPDVGMVFLVLLGILLLLKADIYPKHYSKRYFNILCFFSGLYFGLGLLIRSLKIALPIVALFPFFLSIHRRHRLLYNPYLYIGFIVGLIPTFIWIWLSYLHYGYRSVFQLLDFVFQLSSKGQHGNSIIFYVWNVPLKSFPWFFFAILGFFSIIRRPQQQYKSLLVGFPVILLIELSLISTRLSHYSLCLYPFVALLAAVGLNALTHQKTSIKRNLSYSVGIISIILLFAGVIALFIGNSEIHKYINVIIVLGAGWLTLPILWMLRHRFSQQMFFNCWLAGWLVPVWLGLAVLGYNGAFNDYNPKFRKFIESEKVAPIIQSSPVNLVNVGDKAGVLINFYTKNIAARVDTLKEVPVNNYAWVEESQINESSNSHVQYRVIGKVKGYSLIQVIRNSQNS